MTGKRDNRRALGNTVLVFAVTLPMLLIAIGSAGIFVYEASSTAVADAQQQ